MDTLVKAQIALIGAQEDVAKIRKDWYKVSYEKDGAKIDKALGMRPIFDNFLKKSQTVLHSLTNSGTAQSAKAMGRILVWFGLLRC